MSLNGCGLGCHCVWCEACVAVVWFLTRNTSKKTDSHLQFPLFLSALWPHRKWESRWTGHICARRNVSSVTLIFLSPRGLWECQAREVILLSLLSLNYLDLHWWLWPTQAMCRLSLQTPQIQQRFTGHKSENKTTYALGHYELQVQGPALARINIKVVKSVNNSAGPDLSLQIKQSDNQWQMG